MARPGLSEQETRDLIVNEAEKLFLRIGYRKTTIADIAKACGFSTANVHRVFGTKSSINEAIAERMLADVIDRARAASCTGPSEADNFCAFVGSVHDDMLRMVEHRPEMNEMVAAAINERWGAVRRFRLELLAILTEIVERGASTGAFRVDDPKRAARAAFMALKRLFHPLLISEMMEYADEGVAEDLMPFLLRGLGAARAD
ncbi:MAG: TetR family transcriptional regulator [Pseudomonadota bacterium]